MEINNQINDKLSSLLLVGHQDPTRALILGLFVVKANLTWPQNLKKIVKAANQQFIFDLGNVANIEG